MGFADICLLTRTLNQMQVKTKLLNETVLKTGLKQNKIFNNNTTKSINLNIYENEEVSELFTWGA